MKDEGEWTAADRKSKTEKRYEGERSKEKGSTRSKSLEKTKFDAVAQNMENAEDERRSLSHETNYTFHEFR